MICICYLSYLLVGHLETSLHFIRLSRHHAFTCSATNPFLFSDIFWTLLRRTRGWLWENRLLYPASNDIENKLLENNIVMHGVEEPFEESELQRKRKVKAMISHTVNRSTVAERMEVVENIPIEWTERFGRYNEQRSRPTNEIST